MATKTKFNQGDRVIYKIHTTFVDRATIQREGDFRDGVQDYDLLCDDGRFVNANENFLRHE